MQNSRVKAGASNAAGRNGKRKGSLIPTAAVATTYSDNIVFLLYGNKYVYVSAPEYSSGLFGNIHVTKQ